MSYHIDPDSLKVVPCRMGKGCRKVAWQAHYENEQEAREALAMSTALERISSYSCVVNFSRGFSGKTQEYFLEASLKTPFNEEVYFTVEPVGDHSIGSLLLAGKEHILAKAEGRLTGETLESLAKETITNARRFHRTELWPAKSVIDLYRKLSANSTATELVASTLKLREFSSPGATQLYRGETARGTEVTIKAAYGYAIATVEEEGDSELIYEAGISSDTFRDFNERNAFAAKAFGELIELGDI